MYSISDSLRLQFGLPSFLCVFSLLLSSWTPWSNTIIIHLGKLFSLSSCFTHSVKQPELSHSKYIQWVPISVHKCRMCSCWYHLVYKSALCLLQGCLINGRFYHPFPQGCICVFPEVSRQVEIWCLVSLSHLASMTMFLIVFGPRLLVHVNCYIIIPNSHLEDALGSVSLSLSLSLSLASVCSWPHGQHFILLFLKHIGPQSPTLFTPVPLLWLYCLGLQEALEGCCVPVCLIFLQPFLLPLCS